MDQPIRVGLHIVLYGRNQMLNGGTIERRMLGIEVQVGFDNHDVDDSGRQNFDGK